MARRRPKKKQARNPDLQIADARMDQEAFEVEVPPVPIFEGEQAGEEVTEQMSQIALTEAGDAMVAVPMTVLGLIAREAEEHNFRFRLPQQVLARVKPEVKHPLRRITRIHVQDGEDFFRCWAKLVGAEELDFHPLDLTLALVGGIIAAVEADVEDRGPLDRRENLSFGPARLKLEQYVPRWAGSVSFAPVIEQARGVAQSVAMNVGSTNNPARQVLSISEALVLRRAHVVRVDPEQVSVLPQWESVDEVLEFALDAQLPFDSIYLDFEGPGGIAPVAGEDGHFQPILLSGALMWRNLDDGSLIVAPVAWPERTGIERTDYPWTKYETTGWFVFGKEPLRDEETGEFRSASTTSVMVDSKGTGGLATSLSTDAASNAYAPDDDDFDEELRPELPGAAILGFNKDSLLARFEGDKDKAIRELLWWSDVIWQGTCKALAALSIVEAEEVILVDAPMEKRDHKRAVKRGWPIAQQVVIRPATRRRDGERTPPSGAEAHYSHRFWVRGHFKHFPIGTRLATSRPDLVRPCPRSDAATNCGFCRRVWTPPFIKGDPDKPLILKTLVRRKESLAPS